MKLSIQDGILFNENRKFIDLGEGQAEKYIIIDDFIYLLIDFPNHHPEQNSNIWKLNSDGKIIWKITPLQGEHMGACPFDDIQDSQEGVIVDNWIGARFLLNLETGAIIPKNPNQRPW